MLETNRNQANNYLIGKQTFQRLILEVKTGIYAVMFAHYLLLYQKTNFIWPTNNKNIGISRDIRTIRQ